jgi:hypothetical protein
MPIVRVRRWFSEVGFGEMAHFEQGICEWEAIVGQVVRGGAIAEVPGMFVGLDSTATFLDKCRPGGGEHSDCTCWQQAAARIQ